LATTTFSSRLPGILRIYNNTSYPTIAIFGPCTRVSITHLPTSAGPVSVVGVKRNKKKKNLLRPNHHRGGDLYGINNITRYSYRYLYLCVVGVYGQWRFHTAEEEKNYIILLYFVVATAAISLLTARKCRLRALSWRMRFRYLKKKRYYVKRETCDLCNTNKQSTIILYNNNESRCVYNKTSE